MNALFEIVPCWHCRKCGCAGSLEDGVPAKCPKCESEDIEQDPVKKGGPDHGPEIKH